MNTKPAKITICSDDFTRYYGQSPRGRGGWMFCPADRADTVEDIREYGLTSPGMTYTDAKKWLRIKVAMERERIADEHHPINSDCWIVLT